MTYNTLQAQTLHYFGRPHGGIPSAPVSSPAAWRAADMTDRRHWCHTLEDKEVAILQRALAHAEATGKATESLTAADFPLEQLAPRLAQWRQAVMRGRGLQVIRGVPTGQWSQQQSEKFFWCLGQHLGVPGAQNRDNDLLGHVRDDGSDESDPRVRQYRTTAYIPFHCDAADIVGLLCLRSALAGGLSRVVSSVTVFNELLRSRPDLVPRLFQPFHLDAHREGGVLTLPIRPCRFHAGELRTFFHTLYFRTAARYEHVRLSDQDRELLDVYDGICADPANFLDMALEEGDIQLLSNHTILHSRTDYRDHPEPSRKRHLLRLWVSVNEPRSIGERWSRFWARVELGCGVIRERLRYRLGGYGGSDSNAASTRV